MSKFDEFVTEHIEYEIECGSCSNTTDRDGLADMVVRQAERLGFQVIDGDIYCCECAEAMEED